MGIYHRECLEKRNQTVHHVMSLYWSSTEWWSSELMHSYIDAESVLR